MTAMLTRPAASPTITPAMVEAALLADAGLIVTDDATGETFALPRLTAGQAEDPRYVVQLDHAAVHALAERAPGRTVAARYAAAARAATVELATEHDAMRRAGLL